MQNFYTVTRNIQAQQAGRTIKSDFNLLNPDFRELLSGTGVEVIVGRAFSKQRTRKAIACAFRYSSQLDNYNLQFEDNEVAPTRYVKGE